MESALMGRVTERHYARGGSRPEGFSLLEMIMVVTVILIVASISAPIYMTAVVRAREAVLADHLFTLRALIDRFTLDNGRAPASLQEIVEKGYLGRVPTDPFTGSNETWAGRWSRCSTLRVSVSVTTAWPRATTSGCWPTCRSRGGNWQDTSRPLPLNSPMPTR